jgi:hypothetical protein
MPPTIPNRRDNLGDKPSATPEQPQGPLLNRSNVIKNVMGSAAEAEVGALYDNLQEGVPLRNTLRVEWGELDLMPSRSTGHMNNQQAPAIFFWTYWQRLLRVISNQQGKLFGHLGNWLEPGGRLRRKWNAYFDPKYKFLYRLQNDTYQQYELFDTRFINRCITPWQWLACSWPT